MNYTISTESDLKDFSQAYGVDLPVLKISGARIESSGIELFVEEEKDFKKAEEFLSLYMGFPVVFKNPSADDRIDRLHSRLLERVSLLKGVLDSVKIEDKTVRIEVSNDFIRDRISVNGSKHAIDEVIKEVCPGMGVEISTSPVSEERDSAPEISFEYQDVPAIEPRVVKKEKTPKKPKPTRSNITPIKSLEIGMKAWITGKVFSKDFRNGKNPIFSFSLVDSDSAINCKAFGNLARELSVSIPKHCMVSGKVQEDKYTHDTVLLANSVERWEPEFRTDAAEKKRVELHLHSTMSAMDGLIDPEELFETLKRWGHKAVAITDHGVIQAFPTFEKLGSKTGIKPIYGIEAYVVDDTGKILRNGSPTGRMDSGEFVVMDFETTGLNALSDEIIEIGAVKLKDSKIVGEYHSMVKPKGKVSRKSFEITGITPEELEEAPEIEKVLPEFLEFVDGSIIVAHNADFDYRFLRETSKRADVSLDLPYIDTLQFSKALLTLSGYGLERVVKALNVGTFNHHRALDDTKVTAEVFLKLVEMAAAKGISTLEKLNNLTKEVSIGSLRPYHMTVLVKDVEGLYNLYSLVSQSHITYFKGKPRIPKSLLEKNRKGLLIGSACISGELAENYFGGASEDELIQLASFYNFLEVMPLDVINDDDSSRREISRDLLKSFYQKVYSLGKSLSIPVIMTGDVHFLNPEDSKVRSILLMAQDHSDSSTPRQPVLHLRTTGEMLDAAGEIFDGFEGSERICEEIVIENTNRIADEVEKLKIVDTKLHPPKIDNAEESIRKEAYENAAVKYGDPLPQPITERLERELHSIIDNGYAVLYLIAKKLVAKSKSDGYVVGSRGSVGSSLVATMLGITEVNPLNPHYYCPKCHLFEFDESVESGYDLDDRKCPKCGTKMLKDGQGIPFETFMGFHGDKVPDIDLNFSGDYQSKAHKYIEELFGEGHVFRAGTISTIAERTAYGFVKGYIEKSGELLNKAEVEYLASRLTGTKRTTGQHPGGLMIVPKDLDIHRFTPVQRPANDSNSDVTTTHFDYHSIHDTLVKLDILGHDDPTTMRMLKEITGIDPMTVPMDDRETIKIFSSTKPLGLSSEDIGSEVGTYGIPEFGTRFVRQMLVDTKPKSFGDLVRISGLSHGTDVWANNAQTLIRSKKATLENVIACRDDIMNYLIHKGMEHSPSFTIMEKVRKGKGLTEDEIKEMTGHRVPKWYVDSCLKIKYLFPKAHAVAYVSMAFRIAYFKVHMPLAFYATYLTIKGGEFDIKVVNGGLEWINLEMKRIQTEGADNVKDRAKESVLEIVKEMLLRGFSFKGVDIFKSSSKKFTIEDNALRVPLNRVPGLGDKVASSIEEERGRKPFKSIEDLKNRTLLNKTHLQLLKEMGALKGLPENDQITLI